MKKDLRVHILKWLYTRKDNILISKSMLPKLNEFKTFTDTEVWSTIDSLKERNFVALKKITNGTHPFETVSISEQGEYFLQQNHLI